MGKPNARDQNAFFNPLDSVSISDINVNKKI